MFFMSFHTEKGGVFIGPNGFKIGAKKCHIPGIRDTGGTTTITGQYYCHLYDPRWYHRRTGAVPPLAALLPVVPPTKNPGALLSR